MWDLFLEVCAWEGLKVLSTVMLTQRQWKKGKALSNRQSVSLKKKKKIVKTEGIDLVRMQGQHVLCMETVLFRDVVLVQC